MKLKQIFLIYIVISFPIMLLGQLRPLTYLSQLTKGTGLFGNGNISTGLINNDEIADIALTGSSTYQIGYGFVENGKLRIEIQPNSFYYKKEYFFNGQIVDVNKDGLNDFVMRMHKLPYQFWTYIIENENYELKDSVDIPYPKDVVVTFGHLNDDNIIDSYAGRIITDGATGQVIDTISFLNEANNSISYIDINGDGVLDISIRTNSSVLGEKVNQIWINNGNYSFEKFETTKVIQTDSYGDFDGDGNLDAIKFIGNSSYQIKTKLLTQDSSETFDLQIKEEFYDHNYFVSDIDTDGYADVITFLYDSVYYSRNNHDNTFETFQVPLQFKQHFKFTHHDSWPDGYFVAYELDGVPLIYHFSFENNVFKAEIKYKNVSPTVLTLKPYGYASTILDLDKDGVNEVVLGQNSSFSIGKLRTDGTSDFSFFSPKGISRSYEVGSIVSGDFNQDGCLDLAYNLLSLAAKGIEVSYCGADTLSHPVIVTSSDKYQIPSYSRVHDFDGNGYPDIAFTSNGKSGILFNQDGYQFVEKQLFDFSSNYWKFIDPNKDGRADLAIPNHGIYMNDGNGNLTKTLDLGGQSFPKSNSVFTPYIIDINGPVKLFQINEDGSDYELLGEIDVDESLNSRTSYQLDYNQDGLPDLLFNKRDTAYIILTSQDESWKIQQLPNLKVESILDYDGDGIVDVIWRRGIQLFVEKVYLTNGTKTIKSKLAELKITPNPTTDIIQYTLPNDVQVSAVEIRDNQGKLHLQTIDSNHIMDVSNLHNGVYYLTVKTKKGLLYINRFVKISN